MPYGEVGTCVPAVGVPLVSAVPAVVVPPGAALDTKAFPASIAPAVAPPSAPYFNA